MGYKREQFVDKVDENLMCPICHEVFQNPHGCKDGHSFCKDCITEWLKTRQKCPLDNNTVLQANNLVRNLIVHNMVQNLEVWCHPQETDEGAAEGVETLGQKCKWKGNLHSLARHRKTCFFQQVQCPNKKCNTTMQRRELEDHDRVCEYKRMECDKCRKGLVRHELQDHTADECPETLIPCPNKCTRQGQRQIQQIKRVDLDSHIKSICPKAMVFCPFMDQGCSVQVERQHVDIHVQDNMAAHMLLLAKENNKLKEELIRVKEEFHDQLLNSRSYTWVVRDYPELSKKHPNGSCIKSPTFWLRGYKWRILLYPNGDPEKETTFLSLFLKKVEDDSQASDVSSNKSTTPYRLTVISQKPGTDDVNYETEHVFTKEKPNLGWPKFMKAYDALSPSYCNNGRLIIQCTIQLDKPQ